VPYQTAPSSDRQPVFIHETLGRILSEKRENDSNSPLRAFSYRETKAGKTPTFGSRPQRGNGPVKLQTNLILSSGETLETTQDAEGTLEDLRDGDYIVAGRVRSDSRGVSVNSSVPTTPPPLVPNTLLSPNPPSVSTQQPWGNTTSSPLVDIPENAIYEESSPTTTYSDPVVAAYFPPQSYYKHSSTSLHSSADGLGISDSQAGPIGILKTSSKVSLLEAHEEQNPTIRALWKAEYGRLVAMYGQDDVHRNILDLERDAKTLSGENRQSRDEGLPSFALERLPRPSMEHREGASCSRLSHTSRTEPIQHEDTSDDSSNKRLSFMSSAGHSYTTGTSVGETDSITTREDIRKIVDDMRSTYLRAIETREPSLQAVKSMKKRKKKPKSTTPAGTPRTSSIARSSMRASTPEPPPISPYPATDDTSPMLRSQRTSRIMSHPVAGVNRLPAIYPSPSRDQELGIGLKRADSSTLGTLMGEKTRASIKTRKSKRHSRRPSTQSKSSDMASTPVVVSHEEPVLDTDIANLYSDFWQSSQVITSTVYVTSSFESSSAVFDTAATSPLKKSALIA
jgi:hypothetical protein